MKTIIWSRLGIALAAAAAIVAGARAQAETPAAPRPGGEHRGPPQEAIAACKASLLNQACSFTSPMGAESGTCWRPDASHPLACRPDRNKGNAGNGAAGKADAKDDSTQRRGPPPEFLAACKGHKANDACSFTSPKGAESGTCFQPDTSKPLACRPAAAR